MEFSDEGIIAKCYIDIENDEANVCYLTETSLLIKINNRISSFFIHWISEITFKRKKFLFPIVLGGIAAPLATLGLLQFYLNPWIMMGIIIISCLSIYYGYEGGLALCITTPIKEYDFFIKRSTPNLKSFTSYVQQLMVGDSIRFYFRLTPEEWETTKNQGFFIPEKSGLELSSLPLKNNDSTAFYLESKNLTVEIKYVQVENEMRPTIFNPINVGLINAVESSD